MSRCWSVTLALCLCRHLPVFVLQLTLLLGNKAVFVLNVNRKDGPVELTFSERYGDIVEQKW